MLAAVKDASRRWWPSAILDRGCARRQRNFRSGQRNGPQPNKETHGRLDGPAGIRERAIRDIGLTRAAGVVCPSDCALKTTSVLAATVVDWISRRSRPIIAKVCAKKLSGKSAKGRFLTLPHRPTQPQVAACLQRWVNPPEISIIPKHTIPNIPNFCATLAMVVLVSHRIAA